MNKAERFFSNKYGAIIAALVATFLWGSAFPFIKISYNDLNIEANEIGEQILFAGYRFFIAALIIIIVFQVVMKKNMTLKQTTIKPLIRLGLFQTFLQYILFYIGLSYSTGVQGSIIAGTTSFFQILFAHFMYKNEKINLKKTIGLCIGFTGVIFVNLTKGNMQLTFGVGEWLLLFSTATSAFGNLLARNTSAKIDVGYLTAYQMLFGSLGLLIIGVIQVGFFPFTFTISSFFVLIYLAFASAFGFVLWNNVMKYNEVGKVSMYLFLIPIFGVFLSALLLNELIHIFTMVGLALVTIGIIFVNREKRLKADHQ